MSSAGIIAHCLTPTASVNEWIYDFQVGSAGDVSDGTIIWDPTRERFLCLVEQSGTGVESFLMSSPDGRPPWRIDHSFTEYYQYSSEPGELVLGPNGRVVTSVTQQNSSGNVTGQYFLYSDNLTDWFVSPTLATTLSKRDYLVYNGYRYMAFGVPSTTAHRTTDGSLTVVESCSPPSTSGNMSGVLVWDNGGVTDKRIIITVDGNAGGGLDGKIMYTDDGGTTWADAAFNTPDPNPQSPFAGIVTDGTTIRVYKLISSSMYTYDSVDGGLTFTPSTLSSGTSSTTPVEMYNYYDGLWWGAGRDSGTPATTEPQILSSANGLRPFTREDITQWPALWPGRVYDIAHNERISLAFGRSSGSGTSNNGFIAYKYRI